MTDVTLPADVAKRIAEALRRGKCLHELDSNETGRWADLLDPPPALREQVTTLIERPAWVTDAALAVVADALAARPLVDGYASAQQRQRDADVAWIRSGGTR